jgi:ribosomal protein S18 acetylase RimI-like enzyme
VEALLQEVKQAAKKDSAIELRFYFRRENGRAIKVYRSLKSFFKN